MPTKFKTCSRCLQFQSLKEFRFLNREKKVRASECRECRNQRLRAERKAEKNKDLLTTTREIRRASTTEQMLFVVSALVDRLGGWVKLVDLWYDLATGDSATEGQRFRVTETVFHMSIVAELERVRTTKADASESLDAMHERGRLVPEIRAMLADGRLTLDDIDPPPDEHMAE